MAGWSVGGLRVTGKCPEKTHDNSQMARNLAHVWWERKPA